MPSGVAEILKQGIIYQKNVSPNAHRSGMCIAVSKSGQLEKFLNKSQI
jgi:hypothetical protein